jgi:2-(1,2-epoxy-1,2-dihydrophenyl)acetyl-CoA isomerase
LRDQRIGLWDCIAAESRAQGELGASADYREGFTAFQQKRQPTFRGA